MESLNIWEKISADVTFTVMRSMCPLQQIGGERKSAQFGEGIHLVILVSASQ